MNLPSLETISAHFGAAAHAIYEVLFVLLPVGVWVIVLLSTGAPKDDMYRLAAVPFAGLSLYCATLRDGITAFHKDTPEDSRERDLVVTAALIGVTLCTVLLTMAVLYSRHLLAEPLPIYYRLVWFTFAVGIALVYTTKHILILRKKFGHYA